MLFFTKPTKRDAIYFKFLKYLEVGCYVVAAIFTYPLAVVRNKQVKLINKYAMKSLVKLYKGSVHAKKTTVH